MTLRSPLAITALVTAVVLALVLWWVWPGASDSTVATPAKPPAAAASNSDAPGAPTSADAAATPPPRNATDADDAQAATEAIDWPLVRRLESADDLHALAESIREDAANNDPEALWTLGRIFDGCELMAVKYGAQEDMTQARRRMELSATNMPPKAAAYHRNQFERCRGFVNDPGAMENAKIWQTLAAEAGHPAAVLRSWIDTGVQSVGTPTVSGISDAVESGHPDALVLAPRLLRLQTPETGAAVDDAIADAAWSLAMCDLGVDCDADAELTRIHCIFDACRPEATLAEALQAGTDPFVYGQAETLAQTLAETIRQGRLAESELVRMTPVAQSE